MRTTPRRDRGSSAAVELMAVAPVLILATLLMVAAGRHASAAMDVASAAHAAARAASLETDPAHRSGAAREQAGFSLAERGLACADYTVTVHTTGPRRAQSVRAELSCRMNMDDVAPLRLPGRISVHGTSSAPVDAYRDQEALQ